MMKRKVMLAILIICLVYTCSVRVYAADERMLLAKAVEAAASDESYTVMVALASVLLNRVDADEYPASIAAVISDAEIDISGITPSTQALRAARDAIDGFDPTGGALEYSQGESDPPFVRLKTDEWCFY
jgi:N-acetylmuramoyl-L-alanine amidase